MKNKNEKDHKYKLEFELVELREVERPSRMAKMARKNLKKLVLNRIDGKIGEC